MARIFEVLRITCNCPLLLSCICTAWEERRRRRENVAVTLRAAQFRSVTRLQDTAFRGNIYGYVRFAFLVVASSLRVLFLVLGNRRLSGACRDDPCPSLLDGVQEMCGLTGRGHLQADFDRTAWVSDSGHYERVWGHSCEHGLISRAWLNSK